MRNVSLKYFMLITLFLQTSCYSDKRISKELITIKEDTDIYIMPQELPEFIPGDDSLKVILNTLEIPKSDIYNKNYQRIVLRMIVNEKGMIIQDSISFRNVEVDETIYSRIRSEKSLMSDWKPGTVRRKPVKTEINLSIKIKD